MKNLFIYVYPFYNTSSQKILNYAQARYTLCTAKMHHHYKKLDIYLTWVL